MQKPFYITTTLPYVNAPLHMGHALEFIRTDTIARFKTLQGYDVYFNTGTDEHGQKIYQKAVEKNKTPQAFVDEAVQTFRNQVASFGISDAAHFVRTSDAHHITSAQAFWKRVETNGYIYKKNYQTKYCVGCELEKTDSELDEQGCCPLHPGVTLELIDEENYFFKYSAFQEKLSSFYESHPTFVVPEFRYNEIKAFVHAGLQDFSISRLKEKMSWGIPVPGDDKHVMYVWFDALTNYISTLGWPENESTFTTFWVEGTPTQYCGKDNTRFQAAMWQAMLFAADIPNSHQIIVNGHITAEGGVKMSKSIGNVVDPFEIVAEYGTDTLRFFLLKEVGSFEDSPFTIERFRASYQANLANGLGNLTSRILTLSENYCDAFVGLPDEHLTPPIKEVMDTYDIQKAMNIIWEDIGMLDALIQQSEPFKVVKVDLEEGKRMIEGLVQKLYTIAVALAPFMPTTSQTIIDLIRQNKKPQTPLFARLS